MFKRIELQINGEWVGCGADFRFSELMMDYGLSSVIIPKGLSLRFWFTESGWNLVGSHLEEIATENNIDYRVVESSIQNPIYRDEMQAAVEVSRDQATLEKQLWMYEDSPEWNF